MRIFFTKFKTVKPYDWWADILFSEKKTTLSWIIYRPKPFKNIKIPGVSRGPKIRSFQPWKN